MPPSGVPTPPPPPTGNYCTVPKDAVDPAKQDGVVYRIPCECCKVYIGKTGRPMQDRIEEHDRHIRLTRTQNFSVSEHAHNTGHYPLWDEVKFIDRDPHCYTRRVKEAIHIRLHPNNINRDRLSLTNLWPITAGAYPGFCSMTRLGVLLLLLDGILYSPSKVTFQHFVRFPWQFSGSHLCYWVERGTVRVKFLAQEHNTMTRPGLEPGPLDPESSALTTRPPVPQQG